MRNHLPAFLAIVALALPAAAADYQKALESLKSRLDPSVFAGATLSAQNQLILKATDKFEALPAVARSTHTSGALLEWQKALGSSAPENLLLSVKWKDGGALWLLKAAGPARIDEWADTRLPFTPDQPKADRFFGYLGGQLMNGTAETGNLTAFNCRLGKTFAGGRYDAAVLYSYASIGEDYSSSSYGLTGRALFPLNKKMGWNLGGSFTRSAPSEGDAVNSFSALGGINFYLPGGSFDVTVSLGNNSMYSLFVGYTLFLTRK